MIKVVLINYNKNDLIDECLARNYETYKLTLDTPDYVPEKDNDKIVAYISKNLMRQLKRVNKADKLYQRDLMKEEVARLKAEAAAAKATRVLEEKEKKAAKKAAKKAKKAAKKLKKKS